MLEKLLTVCVAFFVSGNSFGDTVVSSDAVEFKAQISSDESWRVFPSYAAVKDGGVFKTTMRAWVYEEEDRSVIRSAAIESLKTLLGLSHLVLDENIFRLRARYFLVDNERHKTISVFHKKKFLATGETDESGQVILNLEWQPANIAALKRPVWITSKFIPKTAMAPIEDNQTIQLLPEKGLSVISDIDDTIKHTGVLQKKELLESTFGRPFASIKGMANLYQKFEKNASSAFHYVSSSPWQLQPDLQDFIVQEGFPMGSFHLKSFRLKDRKFFTLFEDPFTHKTSIIESIFNDLPHRDFYLIGDSGEKDPEIYANLAKRFPNRVARILIRLVPTHSADDSRFAAAFAGVDPTKWQLFSLPSELKF
jgi:phosphatidate phosphatase APP1